MGAFALTDENGRNYVIGLRDMKSKSAADTEEVFLDILEDVKARLSTKPDASGDVDPGTRLLLSIKATMSDRAACEKLFNKNIKNLIKEASEARAQLDEGDAAVVTKFLNVYCHLHTLVHAAEATVSATVAAEKGHYDGPAPISNPSFLRANQSGVARLVETSSNAFARGGNERHGVYGKFQVEIQPILRDEFKSQSLPLSPYHGSRFSILFHNSSVIYAIRDHLIRFLETGATNGLLKSIQHDLSQPFLIGETKAIAAISKTIMKPYWAMLEDKEVNYAQMGAFFRQLITFMEAAAQDPEMILDGRSSFPEKYLRKDAWWNAVFRPNEICDPFALTALGVILPTLIILFRSHLQDFLEGGEMVSLSEDEAKGLPKTNKFCESIFGFFDRMLRMKPATSTLTIEAFTLWTFNKTADWLAAKDDQERATIIAQTRKDSRVIKATYKERQAQIADARRESLLRLRAEKERKQREKAEEISKLCVKLHQLGGLWKTGEDIDSGIQSLGGRKGVILDAIKTQLHYRWKVMEQKLSDPKTWNFSEGRVQFSPAQMIEKLKLIASLPLVEL